MTKFMNNGVNAAAPLLPDRARPSANPAMLFRRWLANPLQMGSIVLSSPALCRGIVRHDAIEAVAPGRGFLHFSYCVTSPLPWRRHALTARRGAWNPLNFPPASVWRYTPA